MNRFTFRLPGSGLLVEASNVHGLWTMQYHSDAKTNHAYAPPLPRVAITEEEVAMLSELVKARGYVNGLEAKLEDNRQRYADLQKELENVKQQILEARTESKDSGSGGDGYGSPDRDPEPPSGSKPEESEEA